MTAAVEPDEDRTRAERILDSAQVAPEDAPCAPRSPVAGPLGARPDNGLDLGAVGAVDGVVICQYQPAPDPADADLPSLRAAVRLTPNLQYIIDPDQLRYPYRPKPIPDVLVIGAKLSVDLFTLAGLAKGPGDI